MGLVGGDAFSGGGGDLDEDAVDDDAFTAGLSVGYKVLIGLFLMVGYSGGVDRQRRWILNDLRGAGVLISCAMRRRQALC